MEKIIGLLALVASGFYFYALTFYMLLERQSWEVIAMKPHKGKPYRVINGHSTILFLLLLAGILFPLIAHPSILGSEGGYHSFAWFTFAIGLVMFGWCIYVGFVADKGFFAVAIVLVVINYLLIKGIMQTNETICWIIFTISGTLAIYRRKTKEKI